jgi:hypothetical protein
MTSLNRRDTLLTFNRRDFEGDDGHSSASDKSVSHAAILPLPLPRNPTQSTHRKAVVTRDAHRDTLSRTGELRPSQNRSPWEKYKPLLHVRQGCPAILACSIPPDRRDYAVRIITSEQKYQHERGIQQLDFGTGGINRVREIFDWSGKLYVVTDYVRPSLSQLIMSQDPLTEAKIAFIIHAVSPNPYFASHVPDLVLKGVGQPGAHRRERLGSRVARVILCPGPCLLRTCSR